MYENHVFTHQRPGLRLNAQFTLNTLPPDFLLDIADWLIWLLFHPKESINYSEGRLTCQVLGEYTEEQWQLYLGFLQLKQEWEKLFLQEMKNVKFHVGQPAYLNEYGWQKGTILGFENIRGYPLVKFGYHKWNPFSGEYMDYQEVLVVPEALRAQL